jgi:kynurenine formamidase
MDLQTILGSCRIVDLTQTLGPQTVLWPGSRPISAHTTATVRDDGYFIRDLDLPEHAGTHLDAPAHFAATGRTVAEIAPDTLVCPAVVVDVSRRCGDDAAYTIDAATLRTFEERHGRIPAGSAVLVRTGWDRHIGDGARYIGSDRPACPGVGVDAAKLLVERGVVGVGIDTLSIDPGHADGWPAHHVTLGAGLWHLEGLVGLGDLPARGALVVVGVIKLADGSGAPARVLAVVPR